MIKLKDILSEGYAWERKPGGELPTLEDVKRLHEASREEKIPDIIILNYTYDIQGSHSMITVAKPMTEDVLNNIIKQLTKDESQTDAEVNCVVKGTEITARFNLGLDGDIDNVNVDFNMPEYDADDVEAKIINSGLFFPRGDALK